VQKILAPEFAAAIRLLKDVLPSDHKLEPVTSEEGAPGIRLQLPSKEPLRAWLTPSSEAPAPRGGIPIVLLKAGGAREHDALRRAGRSFVDLLGVVHLRIPGLHIDRTDLGPATLHRSASNATDPYSDRSSRVSRVLLMNPSSRRWTTSGLAAAAEVDVSTASRAVRELRRRGLVVDEAPGQGRSSQIRVADPIALLGDWTRRYGWDDNRQLRVAAPVGSASRFIPRMGDLFSGRRWALSLHAGASLVAPHAEVEVVHVYVDASVEALALEHGWESSASGKLVLMEPVYGDSVWFQQRRLASADVVSPVQLVLDLWHYPIRGREQAQHIIETVLRPVWEQDAEP